MTKQYHYPMFISLRLMALALAFGSMGLVSSCSTEDDSNTARDPEPARTYYMSVDATKGSNEAASRTNRALTLSGSTLSASWATNEHVYVQGKYVSYGSPIFWFKGSLQPQSGGTAETKLNGIISLPDGASYSSITEAIGEPHVVTLQFPRPEDPVYTGQNGTLANIAEKYDYAIAENVRVDISTDKVIGVSTIEFINQQAIVKFTLKDKTDGTTLLKPTVFTVDYKSTSDATLTIPSETYTTNGDGVIYVAIPGYTKEEVDDTSQTSAHSVTLTATCADGTYTYTKSNVTFQNGKYYEIGVKMTK